MGLKTLQFFLFVFLFSPQVFSVTADIYDLKDRKVPLFKYVETTETQGDRRIQKGVYTSPDGEVVLTDKLEYQNNSVVGYELDHLQLSGRGHVKIEGNKIKFSYTQKGKTKVAEEALTDNLIVGPSMGPYLQSHWSSLLNGATIKTRLAVLERLETFGFDFSKEREFTENGNTIIEVKMKPTNFIISAIVDPLYLTFNQDGSKLLSIKGRLILKRKVGDDLKDLDGLVAFEH